MNKLLRFLVTCTAFIAILAAWSGCNRDEPYVFDSTDEWNSCGTNGLFARTSQDGPCTRCRTEKGYIISGRNGQLCFDPTSFVEGQSHFRLSFGGIRQDWWQSDSVYLSYTPRPEGTNAVTMGDIDFLGFNNQDGSLWHPPHCESDRPIDYWGNGMGTDGYWSSDGDTFIEEGESFGFRIIGANINDDCKEDWGYVTGRMERDTGFAQVIWRPFGGTTLSQDTIAIGTLLLLQPPDFLPHY